jgi:hypothetical protein
MKKKKFGGPWRLDEEDPLPWLTKESIKFIEKNMKKSDNVLEFGSGASTIFFSKRSNKVISFESGGYSVQVKNLKRSLTWFNILSEKMKKFNITNVELYLLQGYPQSSIVYSHVLDSLLDNSFNWVLIDGGNRNLCIEKGIEKLVRGGYLIIDNYDHTPKRRHITSVKLFKKNEQCLETMNTLLNGWECFKFDEKEWPGLGTIIFKKP